MLDFACERRLFSRGYRLIAALDEAGRGPLAGPVVAACVVFSADIMASQELNRVKDSKKLSAAARQELEPVIRRNFLEVTIGSCDQRTIDRINILQASFLAMKKALGALKHKPDFVILDGGFKIPNFSRPQQAIIRGDANILTIAAASIIAKVSRDQLMLKYHEQYPQYGFNQHKGYGTKLHLQRLKQFGYCPIHRLSFKGVR